MIPKSLKQRIRKHGYIKTAWYVFTVFIIPKIGISIKYVYVKSSCDISQTKKITTDLKSEAIDRFEQLTQTDLESLYSFEGENLLRRMKKDFENGCFCIIGRNTSDLLIGLCWVEPLQDAIKDQHNILIRDCFILPDFRGHNYFTILLENLFQEILSRNKFHEFNIIGNVVLGNESSSRSNIKAGFKHKSTKVKIFNIWNFEIRK